MALNWDDVDHTIELTGVYDGWSIAVMKDGTLRNRWANDDGTPAPGYAGRYAATQAVIERSEIKPLPAHD